MANSVNNISELRKLLKGTVETHQPFYIGEVISVDKEKRIARVKDLQREVAQDVYLQVTANENGLIAFPKVGGWVLVAQTDGDGNGFVLLSEELESFEVRLNGVQMIFKNDEIVFNEGELGGLIKAKALIEKLEEVNSLLQAIVSVINSPTPVLELGNNSASAFKAALQGAIAGKVLPQFIDLEDLKIKH